MTCGAARMIAMAALPAFITCPDCAAPVAFGPVACPRCSLPLTGPAAVRLAHVLRQLNEVAAHQAMLAAQRGALLNQLRWVRDSRPSLYASARPAAGPPPAPQAPPAHPVPSGPPAPTVPSAALPGPAGPSARPAAPFGAPRPPQPRPPRRSRWELSTLSVQNILLGSGGLLLAIAAIAFTIATWSDLGIGGQGAILAGITLATGYAALPLHRTGMTATAETLGALLLVLLVLDAFALGWVAGPSLHGPGYAAAAAAAITGLLGGYTLVVPLRSIRVSALLTAQVIAPIGVLALDAPGSAIPLALVLTAFGDLALYRFAAAPGQARGWFPRLVAVIGTVGWTAGALAAAVVAAVAALRTGPGSASAFWAAGTLAFAGAIALAAAYGRAAPWNRSVCVGAAVAAWVLVCPSVVAGFAHEASWPLLALAVSGTAAAAATGAAPAARGRAGLGVAAGAALAVSGVYSLPALAPVPAQLRRIAAPWQDVAADPVVPIEWSLPLVLTLTVTAAGWTALAWSLHRRWTAPIGLYAATAAALAVAGMSGLPHTLTVALLTATAVLLFGVAAAVTAYRRDAATAPLPPSADADHAAASAWWSTRIALALFATVVCFALAAALSSAAATVIVSAVLAAAVLAGAVCTPGGPVAAAGAAGVPGFLTATVTAAFIAVGASPFATVPALLAVAAAAVGAATAPARAGVRPVQVLALDLAAVLPAGVAVAFALPGGRDLVSLTIAVAAVLALVVSTHPAGRGTVRAARNGASLRLSGPAGTRRPRPDGARPAVRPTVVRRALIRFTVVLSGIAPLLMADRIAAAFTGPLSLVSAVWDPEPLPLVLPASWYGPGLVLLLPALGTALVVLVLCAAAYGNLPPAGGRAFARRGRLVSASAVAAGVFAPVALTHLPVGYGAALAVLVCLAGLVLLGAAMSRGGAAHGQAWTGVVLAVLAVAWSLAGPVPTLLVLASLSVFSALAAAAARPHTPPVVAGALAYLAALGLGAALIAAYLALPFAGVEADLRWLPFTALAMAAALAGAVRTRVVRQRPAQCGGLVAAGLTLTLIGLCVAPAVPEVPGLVAAVAALLPPAFAVSVAQRPGRVIAGAGLLVLLGVVAPVGPRLAAILLLPYTWAAAAWSGARPDGLLTPAAAALSPAAGVPADPLLLPVVTAAALAVLLAVRVWSASRVPYAAALLATPVVVSGAVVTGAAFAVVLGCVLLTAAALAAAAARTADRASVLLYGTAALWPVSLAVFWGFAEPAATLIALGLVAAIAATGPGLSRTVAFSAGATAAAALAAGAFTFALPLALGQPAEVAALAPVAVVAGVAAVLGVVRLDRRVLIAAEAAAGLMAAAAVLLTLIVSDRLELTGVTLAAVGVIALASAPRRGRGWLGVLGGVLLLCALWVFLGWMRVSAPEPYTVVPALAALGAGWEWRRRRPGTGTWRCYGPGLALLLGPGLILVQTGGDALWRVGLLAAIALAAVLVGAWRRLQAPLLIGAAALLFTAFGTPDSVLWESVLRVPKWILVAVPGVLLLVVGARFESSLRQLRRLGRAVRGME